MAQNNLQQSIELTEISWGDMHGSVSQDISSPVNSTDSDLGESVSLSSELNPTEEAQVKQTRPRRVRSVTLRDALSNLSRLIANLTESYSAVVFMKDESDSLLDGGGALVIGGAHTLSREFIGDAIIPIGSGLVGWAAQHKTKLSVCPFEHDSSTLCYYSADQALKSFIAIPIIGSDEGLLGVISCDSKKSYAFSKLTEKILYDCAAQATILIELHRKLGEKQKNSGFRADLLAETLEKLRTFDDEKSLLTAAADLPAALVERDALVILTLSEGGVGNGTFYTAPGQSRVSHRLFELVCKHKLLICGERSVHALPTDDAKQRSFLSVPIQILGKEAGSLNLLSRPQGAFNAVQIAALEQISTVVGRELERIRLRDKVASSQETSGIESWKHFSIRARSMLKNARESRQPMALIRLSWTNLLEIEELLGIEAATTVMQRLMRLLEQVIRQPAISSYLYGFQLLILTNMGEADRTVYRFKNLIERLGPGDFGADLPRLKVGQMLLDGMVVSRTDFPRDGELLEQLTAKTLQLNDLSPSKNLSPGQKRLEAVANVGKWA